MNSNQFKFVDAHVHFYDMNHPTLYYAHWQPDQDHPILGSQVKKLADRNYLADDYILDSKPNGVTKSVHVQAAIGSKDPVEETKWLQSEFERTGMPNAIVGHVDLRSKTARSVIEKHLQYKNFKGIRDFSYGEYLINSEFRNGFSLLQEYGLVSSISAQWQDMDDLLDLALNFPNILIVLDHAGFPEKRTEEYYSNWRSGMSKISDLENVICKISGLGMGDNSWTIQSIRPYVETCLELFGIERSLFSTNWPIDSLWSDFGTVVKAYREITKNYSTNEKDALFWGNSERIYKI